jgi:hypothetical protein
MKSGYISGFLIVAGLVASANTAAASDGVVIPQVSHKTNTPDGTDPELLESSGNSTDYQNEILSNPTLNDRARASAVINQQGRSGNIAIIHQEGGANRSSVIQKGKNNIARQTQKGHKNDIYLEQNGDSNHSQEDQSGENNHKLIIQNGARYEEISKEPPEEADK